MGFKSGTWPGHVRSSRVSSYWNVPLLHRFSFLAKEIKSWSNKVQRSSSISWCFLRSYVQTFFLQTWRVEFLPEFYFFKLIRLIYFPLTVRPNRAHTCWCSSLLRLRAIWSCVSSSMSKVTTGGGFFKKTWRRPLAFDMILRWLFVVHVGECIQAKSWSLPHQKTEVRPFINDTGSEQSTDKAIIFQLGEERDETQAG